MNQAFASLADAVFEPGQFHAAPRPCEESCWGSISAFVIRPCSRLALVPCSAIRKTSWQNVTECHKSKSLSPGDQHRDKSDDRKVCRNYLRGSTVPQCAAFWAKDGKKSAQQMKKWVLDWLSTTIPTSVTSVLQVYVELRLVGRPWHG